MNAYTAVQKRETGYPTPSTSILLVSIFLLFLLIKQKRTRKRPTTDTHKDKQLIVLTQNVFVRNKVTNGNIITNKEGRRKKRKKIRKQPDK